ncbi:hypothetical protein C3K47_06440 [Solitalea longa]|uniref:Uncharacterized protein n=1 Tax=Solitalea longa TaxID=2079460 RepID=A0A2S5A4D6_9SPHI|nr:hypothetical protein [Solitalea longa]POY37396.1 hypothetical protein C3K47_06440 [Solitalea longa]
MKTKIFYIIISLIFTIKQTNAQTLVISPTSYTAEDEITLRFDVTGSPMAGEDPAYLWLWSNAGNCLTNGTSFQNSNDANQLTKISANIWEFKFTGTVAFGKSPAELQWFGCLVKTKDGSKQTIDFKPYNFDPLVFLETQFRSFPAKVSQNDVVTLNFNQSVADNPDAARMTPQSISIKAIDEHNVIINVEKTGLPIKNSGNKTFSYSFIPTQLFATGGTKIVKLEYVFVGKGYDATGKPVEVRTSVAELTLLDLE